MAPTNRSDEAQPGLGNWQSPVFLSAKQLADDMQDLRKSLDANTDELKKSASSQMPRFTSPQPTMTTPAQSSSPQGSAAPFFSSPSTPATQNVFANSASSQLPQFSHAAGAATPIPKRGSTNAPFSTQQSPFIPYSTPQGTAGAPPFSSSLGKGGGGGGGANFPKMTSASSSSGGGGMMSKAGSFIGENKGMIGVGLAAGALNAAGNAFNSMSSRMLNNNFDEFGNLYVLRNGGYTGKTYGDASQQGINKLLPGRYVATSEQDLIGGGAQILVNSGPNFTQNFAAAGATSYAAPGLGIQGGANLEQQLGTNQANVIAQGMFGTATRQRGGGQKSPFSVANSILNATTSGQASKVTPQILSQMLMQGGSLRTNLNTYAQAAGLSQDSVDALAQILTSQSDYVSKNKGATAQDFESVMTQAAQGDKAARAKLKGSGIGESVIQSFENRQGETTGRDISMQAGYIDTLKATNGLLAKLNGYLSDIIGNKVGGSLTGFNAGSGGSVGNALSGAGTGAALGFMVGGPLGAGVGALAGGVGGFIFGGATPPVKTSSTAAPASPPTNTSGAANTAMAFAKAQEGKPYVMGAVGPNAYDCSSLMQAAYKAAGVSIPRVSSQQAQVGVNVPLDQIGPGDLLFPKDELGQNGAPPGLPGHVAMALTGGPNIRTVQAESPSRGIREDYMNISELWGARRVSGGVGTLSPNQNASSDGSTTTNSSTPAGQAQTTGMSTNSSAAMAVPQGSLGMNEIDVLGALLGRTAPAGGPTPAMSAQQQQLSTINGTAGIGSYAKGAYSVDEDQLAQLHKGEIVADAKLSRSFRAAVLSDIPKHTNAGGQSPTINFAQGAINISVGGQPTQGNMQTAAKQFVDYVAADKRIQMIGAGL